MATLAATLAAPAVSHAAAPTTLTINASINVRPVSHVGNGGLYSLATDTTPSVSQLLPLHLNQLTQPAPGVQQLGNGASVPTGDALKVAESATSAGARQTVRMPDIYPNFPYGWVSWSDWLSKVDTMVNQRLAADTTTNINGWELWNEPDWTWPSAQAGAYFDGWNRTYNEVRAHDTKTPIVGPSYSYWNLGEMRSFLQNAIANRTVPEVISWHELTNYGIVTADVQAYRALERELGIGPLPISINEYATPNEVDAPADSLHYVAQFERTGVRDAERAYWFESGTMNGLLHNDQPTSTYWMYKWLGDMAGNIVAVTPNGDQDGVAALDSIRKILDAVVGGASGNNTVAITGLSGFGDQVKVSLAYTPTSGRYQNVPAATNLWTKTLTVTNGSVTVPIGSQDPGGAYNIVVTPADGPTTSYQQVYEAENASINNANRYSSNDASNGSYVGNLDNSGDVRDDSFVDFIVNAPIAGDYDLSIRYANGTGANSTQGLAYDGGAWQTVTYPPTSGWGHFQNIDGPTLRLTQGYNTIRLAKGAPLFDGGVGYAELDSIKLTSHTPVVAPPTPFDSPVATFVQRVEAENATVSDGQKLTSGKASNGGYVGTLNNSTSYVQFPVTVPTAGTYKLTVGYANGGNNNGFNQNGTSDAVVAVSTNGGAAQDLTLPVSGDWGGNGGNFPAAYSTVDLTAGANTVRVTKLVGQNYAEIDYLQVSSPADAVVDGRTTQTITFPAVSSTTVGSADVPLTATASSGLQVTYTATGACSIVSDAVHADRPGTCTVTAAQAGNDTYAPAANTTQQITVAQQAQVTPTLTGSGPRNGWYNSQVVVALTGPTQTDTKVQYQIDGGTWKAYGRSFALTANGAHTVVDRLVRNNVVVDGSTSSFVVSIDKAPPTVTGKPSPSATGSPRNPISVTFTAADTGSGVDSVSYQVNGGDWTAAPADNTTTLDAVGSYVVAYRATDKAGNTAATRSIAVNIVADPATKIIGKTKSVTAGSYATFALAGFHRYSWVTVSLGNGALTTVLADAGGAASVTAQIPVDTAAGNYTVSANDGSLTASTTQKVTAP